MSLWWSVAPMLLVAGFGLASLLLQRLADELGQLDSALIRLERTGVGVDELRHDVSQMRNRVQTTSVRHKSAPTDR